MSVMELKLNKYLVLRIDLLDSSLNSRLDKKCNLENKVL